MNEIVRRLQGNKQEAIILYDLSDTVSTSLKPLDNNGLIFAINLLNNILNSNSKDKDFVVAKVIYGVLVIFSEMGFYPDYLIREFMPLYFESNILSDKLSIAQSNSANARISFSIANNIFAMENASKELKSQLGMSKDMFEDSLKYCRQRAKLLGIEDKSLEELKKELEISEKEYKEVDGEYSKTLAALSSLVGSTVKALEEPRKQGERLPEYINDAKKNEVFSSQIIASVPQESINEMPEHFNIKDIQPSYIEYTGSNKLFERDSLGNQYAAAVSALTELGVVCGKSSSDIFVNDESHRIRHRLNNRLISSDDVVDQIQILCEILCICLRYFALVGKNPEQMVNNLASEYDYMATRSRYEEYINNIYGDGASYK